MATNAASPNVTVPFLDLGVIHAPLREELLADFAQLIDSSAFVNGPAVREFEAEFAAYCGVEHCVGVASGLDALRLGLQAAGLEPGDEVLVPAQTFVATWECVTQAGGVPVPVEISARDWNMDAAAADAAVTARSRFLLPVHLYGQLADVAGLRTVAERHGLHLVEDAAQAHGAERDGVRAGQAGLWGAFSFYPGKNLGAMGDGGALVTHDAALADRLRALREHGQRQKYIHEWEGWTARLDTLQAMVLRRKLRLLDGWNEQRRAVARAFSEGLAGVGDLELPPVAPDSAPVWHLYVVRTARPVQLMDFLKERGVGSGRHYPQPPHLAPAYARFGWREGAFPVAEALARDGVSLPVFPGMREEQVAAVVDGVRAFFAG